LVKKVKLRGDEAIAKALKESGVDYFFYVSGGMLIPSFPAIEKAGINMILCRNEKAATNMADGYARITKKPTVCYGQHGAAAAILASMLYEPMFAHSPVIAITPSTRQRDKWSYQESYEMPYFDATCKFNVDVSDLSRLAEYIRTAIQVAVSGCPGPTHVNVHLNPYETVEMPEIYGDEIFFQVPPFRPRAELERITEAAKLLANSERPVMVCGSGVHLSGAYDEVRELADILTIPVVTNPNGKGCFPEDHPLYAGVVGSYGWEVSNDVVREADLVFFVATRAGTHVTLNQTAPEPGVAKIIHLDIDPIAIGRNYKANVALVGDAKVTLQELLEVLKTMIAKPEPKGQRLQAIAKAIKEYERITRPLTDSDAVPIKPQRLMKEISKVLKSKDIVVSDTGQMCCWTTRFIRLKSTGLTFLPVGGTLGSSFALAMGASFGAKEGQRVINMIGDGGMGYNLTELETIRRYNNQHVPFVSVVNNNSSLAMVRPISEDVKKKPPQIFYSDFVELNYAKIAEDFGCYGVRVERPGEIADALNDAFDSGKPAVIDVVTDLREHAPTGSNRAKRLEPLNLPVY
jgi:acetolactate synthase-1/2/3 large subunit